MSRVRTLLLTTAACCVLSTLAQAQRPPREREGEEIIRAGFTRAERDILVRYFADHRLEVDRLPPGIARRLARGKPLPPGIAKRHLPSGLVAVLPVRTEERARFEITIFGDRIVLLEASGVVVDVLDGVFR